MNKFKPGDVCTCIRCKEWGYHGRIGSFTVRLISCRGSDSVWEVVCLHNGSSFIQQYNCYSFNEHLTIKTAEELLEL